MSWIDDLLPASFRGVAFHYRDAEMNGGRNVAENEYPWRESGYTEDLGRKLRHYRIEAYVIGENYAADRDALLAALEQAGNGTFVHPFDGPITVKCPGFSRHESNAEGGIAYFDIDFVEDGEQPSPTVSVSTSETAESEAAAAQEAAVGVFEDTYTLENYGSLIASYASSEASVLEADLETAISGVSLLSDVSGDLISTAAAIPAAYATATGLAVAVSNAFTAIGDAIIAALPDGTVDETVNSRGGDWPGDPSYGLAALAAWGGDVAAISGETEWKIEAASNRAALIVLVQSCAVAQLARVYASTVFVGSTDAEAARDQLTGFIEALIVSAADNGDDTAYNAWMALLSASTDDLTTRGKKLPDVVSVDFSAPLPAVVVAQKLYADAGRAGEIVSRNSAEHPLFLPIALEVLSE
jgi:prophage DNA circulation protein